MNILVFGGFLGSGKTTVIQACIQALAARGEGPIAIIENEIGEVGVDDVLLAGQGVTVRPLMGGCVCCEIRGSLLGAVAEIHAALSPAWLIIELTGLAVLPNIVNALRDHTDEYATTYVVSVVDAGRWDKLYGRMSYFVHAQLAGCDAIVLNKVDLCADADALVRAVVDFAGVEDIVRMAPDAPRAELCDRMLSRMLGEAQEGLPRAAHAADTAAEDSLDAGAVSWVYRLEGEATCDTALLRRTLDGVFRALGMALAEGGAVFGHIKGVLTQPGGGYMRLSTTRPGMVDMQVGGGWQNLSAPAPLVLAITAICVQRTSGEIQALADPCLQAWEALGAQCVSRTLDAPHAHDHHVSAGSHSHDHDHDHDHDHGHDHAHDRV